MCIQLFKWNARWARSLGFEWLFYLQLSCHKLNHCSLWIKVGSHLVAVLMLLIVLLEIFFQGLQSGSKIHYSTALLIRIFKSHILSICVCYRAIDWRIYSGIEWVQFQDPISCYLGSSTITTPTIDICTSVAVLSFFLHWCCDAYQQIIGYWVIELTWAHTVDLPKLFVCVSVIFKFFSVQFVFAFATVWRFRSWARGGTRGAT